MSELPLRRACNRCYSQKLSCKRAGCEPCERCVWLKVECKSSLSRRFRKPHAGPTLTPTTSPQRIIDSPLDGCGGPLTLPSFGLLPSPEIEAAMDLSIQLAAGPSDSAVWIDTSPSYGPPRALPTTGTATQFPSNTAAPDATGFGPGLDCGVSESPKHQMPGRAYQPLAEDRAEAMDAVLAGPDGDGLLDTAWDLHPSRPETGGDDLPPHCMRPQSQSSSPRDRPLGPGTNGVEGGAPQSGRPTLGRHRIVLQMIETRDMAAPSSPLTRLSYITANIWELKTAVPFLVDSGHNADTYYARRRVDNGVADQRFPVDRLFVLSRCLVQALHDMSPMHHHLVESAVAWLPTSDGGSSPARSLLVLAACAGLLDLYENIFHLFQVEILAHSPDEPFRLCRLPGLSVGQFPVAPAPAFQILLAVGLAEEFIAHTSSAVDAMYSRDLGAGNRRCSSGGAAKQLLVFAEVVEASLVELKGKEEKLRSQIADLKALVETLTDESCGLTT